MSAPDSELHAGDEIAGHRITGLAGRGGMGVVYRALQLDLDRPVALKLIATPLASDDDFRERFVREARAAAAIDHPNVIPVYSAGEDDGRLYLAMRFVEGEDLRTLVRREGPLDPHRAASIIAQVGGALDAAHARGLIHRDIKPANVLLDGDHAYLTDFGLTKRLTGETTMTGSGRWVGTLGYISPEQIRGQPVDARADVYALGALLFYVLTGAAPYRRDSDEATLFAHLHDPAPDPRALTPDVPGPMADVVRRALEKDPDDRYPSAGDLGRAALAAAGDGPTPPPERTVARGAAAPGGAADPETAVAGTAVAPTEVAPTRQRTTPRWLAPAASLLAGAAVVVAAVLLLGGGGGNAENDGPATTAPPKTTTTAGPPSGTPQVSKPIKVDSRPNSLALSRGRVWVTGVRSSRLIGLPADGKGARRTIPLPWSSGTAAVVAGYGSLWVLNGDQSRLLRLDAKTGRKLADKELGSGFSAALAVGEGAVWVGRRAVRRNDPPSALLRIDPRTGETRVALFGEEGVADITTGGGFVWVANRRRSRVTRVDPTTLERRSTAVGNGQHRVAWGDNQVWVSNFDDGTITQNNRSLTNRVTTPVNVRGPLDLAYARDTIWVAGNLESAVQRLDARTGDAIGDPIRVGRNPFAIIAHGPTAWVTNLGSGTVTRIDIPA
jgi:streptogramin lyase/predicted Ser/Thr protein kinase